MNILVTGGAGFIGSHVVDGLVQDGHSVFVVDDLSQGKRANVCEGVELFEVDVSLKQALENVFQQVQPEVVFHLAAQIDIGTAKKDPLMDARVNVLGTINVLELSRTFGVRRVVFSSTAAVYGDSRDFPLREENLTQAISPYGIGKQAGERYCSYYSSEHGLSTVVLRYANVYGPRQVPKGEGGVVSRFVEAIDRNTPPVIFGDGEQTRDFVYVGDVSRANKKAMEWEGLHDIFNVSTGQESSINDLFSLLKSTSQSSMVVDYAPPRVGEVLRNVLSPQKAHDHLRWESTVSLDEGIEKVYSWSRGEV